MSVKELQAGTRITCRYSHCCGGNYWWLYKHGRFIRNVKVRKTRYNRLAGLRRCVVHLDGNKNPSIINFYQMTLCQYSSSVGGN